jgi:hypothetical protein
MRLLQPRTVTVLLAVTGLALTACSNTAQTRRTTTVVQTVTGSQAAGTASGSLAPTSGTGITVVAPSGSATAPTGSGTAPTGSGSATAATSKAKPTTTAPVSTSQSAAPINTKVNMLDADCSALLNATDINKVTGKTVPTATSRIRDVANPDRKITGKVRCLYGVKGKDSKVVVGLTKFASPAGAKAQVAVTKAYEVDKGAEAKETTVAGYPAQVLLRDGGLIVLPYGVWTLGVAVDKDLLGADPEKQLQQLAEMTLARVLKTT